MANNSGYKVINGTRPAIDTVNAAKAEISAEKLRYLGSKSSLLGFETLGWGDNCERLLHDGLDLWNDSYIKELLNNTNPNSNIRSSEVVFWMRNNTQLGRFHAGKDHVFIYRPLEEALGPHNGFFKVVAGSHNMRPEQIAEAEAEEIQLQFGQALILDGDVVIEYPMAGGGIGLVKCLSKK